jgi:2-polyprenyl-3-methyl-5-hydroxy-6-metoxy-1,4-benzoquinol methylase
MEAVPGGHSQPAAGQAAGQGGWPDFSGRADEPEWMDVRPFEPEDFARVLADLEKVNRLTRAAPPTLAFLARLTHSWPAGSELRVADLGYGQGEMLRRIHRWAEARGLRPHLTGVDLNPACRRLAIAHTPPGMAIDWHQGDLFDWAPAEPPHAIVSALFTHHLPDTDVVRLLRWQEDTASHGWFVNDLHRHWAAWAGFRALAWAARWHPCVRHDGALSVRRAFTPADWDGLLAAAGIEGAERRWHPLFRLCITRVRGAPPPGTPARA